MAVIDGGYGQLSDGSSELDERMGLVVWVVWKCLAVGTEVGVVANGTLESVSSNIGFSRVGIADWSVAVDASVRLLLATDHAQLLVDWCKPVIWVYFCSNLNTCRAVIKVGAAQALVSNPNNLSIAAITDSLVLETSAWLAKRLDVW